MPRISVTINLDEKEAKGSRWSAENDCLDFCRRCCRNGDAREYIENYKASQTAVQDALREFDYNPDGEEHPPYDDCDYTCESCGKTLTSKDD